MASGGVGGAGGAPIVVQGGGPGLLIRLVYFVFVGWWLGGLVSLAAWLLVVTIIGLPLGLYLLNRLPSVITLRPQGRTWTLQNGVLRQGVPQRGFLPRALWFALIGWWLSAVWMTLAWLCMVTLILIPLAFWMYGRVGAITTLYRS